MAANTAIPKQNHAQKMAANSPIPIHPNPPRFVDSATQPLIIYYLWNIDDEKFDRKRMLLPENIFGIERKKWVKEKIAWLNKIIEKGGHSYNNPESVKPKEPPKEIFLTIQKAMNDFIAYKSVTLSDSSIKAYKGYMKWFMSFAESKKIVELPIKDFTFQHAQEFIALVYNSTKIKAKTHNEIISLISSTFNHYKKNRLIAENPFEIKQLKIVESEEGHHPYTLEQIAQMKEYMLAQKTEKFNQFWLFVNFCFYTKARPRKELRLLQVKDLHRNTIFIRADRAKNNKSRHIIISHELHELIEECKLRKFHPESYVFSIEGKPGTEPTGYNYFYKINRIVLQACELTDKDYDLYSWKHTGNIFAYEHGTDIYDLKEQNGHHSVQQTERYLRKIGAIREADKNKLKHPKI